MNGHFISLVLSGVLLCLTGITTDGKFTEKSKKRLQLYPKANEVERRSFLKDVNMRWPYAIVPYELDGDFDIWSKLKIKKAIKLFQQVSCVRFVPHKKEKNYVVFTLKDHGCSSSIGRKGGKQIITLSSNCLHVEVYNGSVVHEMMHTLGFIHEQLRDDRDCYLKLSGIGKVLSRLAIIFGTDTTFIYDFNSIMHYKERPIMKGRHNERLGNLLGTLTEWDKMKLNYMYCRGPHYCDLYPRQCKEDEKKKRFCRVNESDVTGDSYYKEKYSTPYPPHHQL